MNDLTVLILSCQKFSDMWSNNLSLLKKNWPDLNVKKVLVSDGKGIFDIKTCSELTTIEGGMSERFIEALKMIDTNYVFVTFDDYYFSKPVKHEIFLEVFDYVKENDISYCGFHLNYLKGRRIKIARSIKAIDLDLRYPYEINLYPSIWKKEDILSVLRSNEDIWKTEVRLTSRFKKINKRAIAFNGSKVLPFVDIVRKGEYLYSGYQFIKKNGLHLSDRPVKSFFSTYWQSFLIFLSVHSPAWLLNLVRKTRRKLGKANYSDYSLTED